MIANIKYNEINYAKDIYINGFQSKYYSYELKLLAVYLGDFENMSLSTCKDELIMFCQKNYPGYTYALCYTIINKAIAAYKNKSSVLIDIQKVEIYEDEYDNIIKIGLNDTYTLILFAMLIRKKLSRQVFQIKNKEESKSTYLQLSSQMLIDIKTMSGLSSKRELLEALAFLNQHKIISIGNNAVACLNFMIETNEVNPVIIVRNYEDTHIYIRKYWGDKKVKNCLYCGEPFLSRCSRQIFCKSHITSKSKSIK